MVKHTIGKTYCRRCIIRSSWWVEVGASSLDIRRAGEDERCRNLLPCSHREWSHLLLLRSLLLVLRSRVVFARVSFRCCSSCKSKVGKFEEVARLQLTKLRLKTRCRVVWKDKTVRLLRMKANRNRARQWSPGNNSLIFYLSEVWKEQKALAFPSLRQTGNKICKEQGQGNLVGIICSATVDRSWTSDSSSLSPLNGLSPRTVLNISFHFWNVAEVVRHRAICIPSFEKRT